MPQEEQVLVVERKVIEEVGLFNGLMFDIESYTDRIFVSGVPRFMPRSLAEKDPSFKQLIPYVIMACDGKYLTYVRGKRAGETRLVGNRSIGIGGHINPVDNEVPLFDTDYRELYDTAVARDPGLDAARPPRFLDSLDQHPVSPRPRKIPRSVADAFGIEVPSFGAGPV